MVAASTAISAPAGASFNDAAGASGTAPIKDEFIAKLAAREALKEKNQKYWEDDPYSKLANEQCFCLLAVQYGLIMILSSIRPDHGIKNLHAELPFSLVS